MVVWSEADFLKAICERRWAHIKASSSSARSARSPWESRYLAACRTNLTNSFLSCHPERSEALAEPGRESWRFCCPSSKKSQKSFWVAFQLQTLRGTPEHRTPPPKTLSSPPLKYSARSCSFQRSVSEIYFDNCRSQSDVRGNRNGFFPIFPNVPKIAGLFIVLPGCAGSGTFVG